MKAAAQQGFSRRQKFGIVLGVVIVGTIIATWGSWGLVRLFAATTNLDPNADYNTIGTITLTTCGNSNVYSCVDEGTRQPTAPSTSGDYFTLDNAEEVTLDLSTETVTSASQVDVWVYHIQNKSNMSIDIGLYDHSMTQIGATTTFATRASATWDTVSFTSLSLTQTQVNGLKIHLRGYKRGGSSALDSDVFAAYAVLTYTGGDTSAPTPNPPYFSTPPDDASASSIDMTSVTVTDPTTPVNYYFTNDNSGCTTNHDGTGGTDSGWQSGTSYTDSGLQPNKCYGYTITARDGLTPTPNTGSESTASTTYTAANVPGTPSLGAATVSTLDLTNNENSNPSTNPTTYFAVQVTNTDPTDGTWDGEWVDGSGDPSASEVWLTDAQLDALTLTGLTCNTQYDVQVKARNADNEETSLSSAGSGTTSVCPDTTPPTPNPPYFTTAPDNVDNESIDMISVTTTDASSTPVQYSFVVNNTNCGADAGTGGTDSGWQAGTSYTDSGLQPNQCYGYTVQSRDALANAGSVSTASTTYTDANVPGTPALSNATVSTLDLNNTENSNPASNPTTYFAAQVVTTNPTDATWLNQWINGSGNPSASEVWQTDAALDAMTINGLNSATQYCVQIKARNEDSEETSMSASGCLYTSGATLEPSLILQGGVRLLPGVRFVQ